ncbi:pentapeptide repeat-containing protein [Plantactinospora solaniradicis]|uniref:Pentapeptide repeat-containing protein n=1 Tax=Plantactinospora solaniradicis TaxID=1723736 RepID=A0ABW1KIV7_9ACTN
MAGLLAYAFLVLLAPDLLLPADTAAMTQAEQLIAAHNARLLAVSFGGALVVLVGLLYTARNYRLSHRGQVTERFTKALERLDSDKLYVRIGGIHALEHVLLDSPEHHAHIVEVLVAFIRDRAPRAQEDIGSPTYLRPGPPSEPDADVQAALTALAYRPNRPRRERHRIRLANLDLQRANLAWAHLRWVDFSGARLDHANLYAADLVGANLFEAGLEHTDLFAADLRGANLLRARLTHADLYAAAVEDDDDPCWPEEWKFHEPTRTLRGGPAPTPRPRGRP